MTKFLFSCFLGFMGVLAFRFLYQYYGPEWTMGFAGCSIGLLSARISTLEYMLAKRAKNGIL